MIPQFNNNLLTSAFLWSENRIGSLGGAFINTTLPFYYAPDPALPAGLLSYASPFKTFVYDSGVSGAIIMQTVSGSMGVLDRSSGIKIDYLNGRVLVPAALGTNLTLTGTMAVREVNLYPTNEDEEAVLTQGKYYFNPRYVGTMTGGGLPPNTLTTPAVFVNTIHDDNKAFALGGLDECTTTISWVVLAESPFQLQAIMSLARDARYKYFPLLNVNQDPLNQWGDTYSGYNYSTYVNQFGSPGQLCYISQAKTSRVSDKIKLNPEQYMGLANFDVSYVRNPS